MTRTFEEFEDIQSTMYFFDLTNLTPLMLLASASLQYHSSFTDLRIYNQKEI